GADCQRGTAQAGVATLRRVRPGSANTAGQRRVCQRGAGIGVRDYAADSSAGKRCPNYSVVKAATPRPSTPAADEPGTQAGQANRLTTHRGDAGVAIKARRGTARIRSRGKAGDTSFPLTPTLSLGERENRYQIGCRASGRGRHIAREHGSLSLRERVGVRG